MFKYRKPTRQHSLFPGLRLTMAVTAFVAGASFCLAGDAWHTQASFYYINQLPIPWWVYGTVLLVGAICIILEKVRPIGYLVGAVIYSFFSVAAWLAVLGGLHSKLFLLSYLNFPPGSVGSFFAACNLTTICVLYWSALKQAIYTQVDPERASMMTKK